MKKIDGIPLPNYTQFPNVLIDVFMREMSLAEFKVVSAIVRLTLGYHKRDAKITVARIRELTGLSRQAVLSGAVKAEERGLVKSFKQSGRASIWTIQLVRLSDTPDEGGSKIWTGTGTKFVPPLTTKKEDLKKDSNRSTKTSRSITTGFNSPNSKEEETGTEKKKRKQSVRSLFSLELEETFAADTGIPKPALNTAAQRKAAGSLWYSPLWEIYKLFRPEEERQGTVKLVYNKNSLASALSLIGQARVKMQEDNLTIAAPKSILAVAISLYSQGNTQGQLNSVDWMKQFEEEN